MSSVSSVPKLGTVRMKRYKTSVACNTCRLRKLKCDGLHPACGRCQKRDDLRQSCTYFPTSSQLASHPSVAPLLPPHLPDPPVSALSSRDQPSIFDARGVYSDDNPGRFTSEVKAVINAKLGIPSERRQCPIPLTDAPLFGSPPCRQAVNSSLHSIDNVLPPRKHADHLLHLYWRYTEPLEPILDRERFDSSYEKLFTGSELECDERIFISTLNAVFALSTQLQESTPSEQRDEASKAYFQRAWSLLRPESVIWEPGSLQLVQCLLLMSQYLRCTRNLHQTWMAVGSAVRIAQSLDLHVPKTTSCARFNRDDLLRKRVWQCCAFMDRVLSWTLGRSSMLPLAPSSSSIESLPKDCDLTDLHNGVSANYYIKMLELNEVSRHLMASQMPTNNSFTESLGLPQLYQNAGLSTAMQIDESLTKLEESLPPPRSLDTVEDDIRNRLSRQCILYRLRLTHARIVLFRPMLTRFCLTQSQQEKVSAPAHQNLGDRVLQDCATLCVESAQRMVALVCDNYRPDAAVGILPWWYRVHFLYVASQHLIAAMLRPDVFTLMAVESWNKAMSALSAHGHLNPSVQRCISSFQTMWQQVTNINYPGGDQVPPLEGCPDAYFQNVFQHLGFEAENSLFGEDNMAWLNSTEWNP